MPPSILITANASPISQAIILLAPSFLFAHNKLVFGRERGRKAPLLKGENALSMETPKSLPNLCSIRWRFKIGVGTPETHLLCVTGATGHDLRDLKISAVRTPLGCAPIWGAEVLFLVLPRPHKCCPGWGPCSEHDRSPRWLSIIASLLDLSCSNRAAISRWTSIMVVDVIETVISHLTSG